MLPPLEPEPVERALLQVPGIGEVPVGERRDHAVLEALAARWVAERRDDLRTRRRLEARAAGGGLLAASKSPEFIRWMAWIETAAGQALGASEALRALVHRSVRVRRGQRVRLVVSLTAVIVVLAVAAGVALCSSDAPRAKPSRRTRARPAPASCSRSRTRPAGCCCSTIARRRRCRELPD